jgi:hypothetical protein
MKAAATREPRRLGAGPKDPAHAGGTFPLLVKAYSAAVDIGLLGCAVQLP